MENPSTLLISPMRNEGPFILEWLAWHRAVGFAEILVLTNECSDGSDLLLDALEARGLLTHLRHSPKPGSFALRSAYEVARKSPLVAAAHWVMALDADEFLVVHKGAGRVQDLLAHHHHSPLGIAVHWKCFGDSGHQKWPGGFVREDFIKCAPFDAAANMRFKSIFRDPTAFSELASHAPFGFNGTWGGDNVWVTTDGKPIPKINLATSQKRVHATAMRRITHDVAQVNHYAVKAQECLTERRLKWAASNRAARYDDEFLERYNINSDEDRSALKREEAFQAEYQPMIADQELRALHEACCHAYRAALEQTAAGQA